MPNDDHRTGESAFTYDVAPGESLSDGVITAISTISDSDPVSDALPGTETDKALDPLYTVVDPEALDSVFRSADDDTARTSGQVTFPYHGYEVTVHSEGRVSATQRETTG